MVLGLKQKSRLFFIFFKRSISQECKDKKITKKVGNREKAYIHGLIFLVHGLKYILEFRQIIKYL